MTGSDKKLTDDTVKAIKILVQKGFTVEQVARMTGVAKSTVRRLVSPSAQGKRPA